MKQTAIPVIALSFLLVASLLAFSPAVSAQDPSTITGRICSMDWEGESACAGEGLPNATITATPTGLSLTGAKSATSDSLGYFSITGLGSGSHTISATRTGFDSVTKTASPGDKLEITLTGKSVSQPLVIMDANGPVAGARVYGYHSSNQFESTSDSDGKLTVAIKAGTWSVQVSAADHYQTSYYGVLDGASRTITMESTPPKDASISGKVTDGKGNPVAGADVYINQYNYPVYAQESSVEPSQGTTSSAAPDRASYYCCYNEGVTVKTGADGSYSAKIYSGSYNVNFHKEGYRSANIYGEVASGSQANGDAKMEKYPDRTVTVTGTVVSGGTIIKDYSISIQNVEWGVYECSQPVGSTSSEEKAIAPGEPYPGYSECQIQINSDGSFTAKLMPGYSIIRVYPNYDYSCYDRSESSSKSCGPEYLQQTDTLVFAENSTRALKFDLPARPAADSFIQGHVNNGSAGIPGAQLNFQGLEGYSWGWATTDKDGSYRVALRSGHYDVYVYAEGFYSYQKTIHVPAKSTVTLNPTMMEGQEYYGGCCYAYAEDSKSSDGGFASPQSGASSQTSQQGSEMNDGNSASNVNDLGGGLGAYKPGSSEFSVEDKGAPGFALLGLLASLGAVLMLARKRESS